jgi:hypothetical protein
VIIMRKFVLLAALALTSAFALTACNNESDEPKAAAPVVQAAATKPTSPTDSEGWKKYLIQIVRANMQGMTADRPYPYLIPAGDDDAANAARQRQLENVQGTVARGVLPGNLIAFGGPDSGKTADIILTAFKDAQPGAFKKVIVLFIGDAADKDRVAQVLAPTGAEFRFVAM